MLKDGLRSDISKTLKGFQKLKDNLLPLNVDVIGHYYYSKKKIERFRCEVHEKKSGFQRNKGVVIEGRCSYMGESKCSNDK